MKISAAFSGITTVAIETAPFIYYVETNPTYIQRMRAIFQLIASRNMLAITSVITLTEVLSHPIRRGDQVVENAYRRLLTQTNELKLIPINYQIADQAAELRARYNLKTPDALQVSTAIHTGCDALLTNDLGLKRITELQILVLDELQLDT
ncbi:MAG: PIN domain-containing protein [Anaerolineae bacterium]|nr:PIN domain-containing protein [Anaerolineae bacterium]